jgi:hypothetical protein
MVASSSRRTPDPSQALLPRTADSLRAALKLQRNAGQEPVAELRAAIRLATQDARERELRPENVFAQLDALLAEAALDSAPQGPTPNRGIRAWLVTACVRAYWDEVK